MKIILYKLFLIILFILNASCKSGSNITDTSPPNNSECIADCADVCGGSAVLSGCDNTCGSTLEFDECGVCGGSGPTSDCGCADIAAGECDCAGNIFDECGVCGGSGISEGECDCNGNVVDECGVCGGGGISEDDCGVCNGGNADDLGCGCFEAGPSGCDDECGSTAELDECGVCGGDGSTCEGLWDVYYDVSVPIAGFQFEVNEGNIINASGGAATEAGLSVSNSSSTVIAFSLSGNTIPSGAGTLISLEIEGDSNSFCISNLVLSDIGGNVIPAIIINCNTIKYP